MKDKILEMLKSSDIVSGEQIAEELGVSRTAVWKQVRSLSELGYVIESQRNKGYRLVKSPDLPVPEEIIPDLGTEIVGNEVIFDLTVTSTNDLGKKLVRDKVTEGTVITAAEQTEGRGRKQRRWSSPEGGLWFSVILYPDLPPERGMLVTMICSISIAEAVKEITGMDTIIKWPNDLLLNGKKLCGVLTEMEAEMDRINSCVIGIGINVNNTIEEELSEKATSLKAVKGESVSRVELLRAILRKLDAHYSILRAGEHDLIREMWKKMSNIEDQEVRVIKEKETFNGIVKDIDHSGCLILDVDGQRKRIVSGDIEYI